MIDQAWEWLFYGAYRQARSDRHLKKNKLENPRLRTKNDRHFFQIPAWAGGYQAGYESPDHKVGPQELRDSWRRWLARFQTTQSSV